MGVAGGDPVADARELFGDNETKPKLPPIPDSPFDTAPRQKSFAKPPEMGRGFHTVVRDIYAEGFDVAAEYKAIQTAFELHDALTAEALMKAANQVENVARRAHRLYILAKAEYERYVRMTDANVAAIRDAASDHLEDQKRKGIRTKQITDADLAATSAQRYPDEWEDVNTKRDRAKGMVAHIEKLAELATIRCRTVGSMLTARGSSKL